MNAVAMVADSWRRNRHAGDARWFALRLAVRHHQFDLVGASLGARARGRWVNYQYERLMRREGTWAMRAVVSLPEGPFEIPRMLGPFR